MFWLVSTLTISAAYPLWRAIRANARTTLLQTTFWAAGAWVTWLLCLLAGQWSDFQDVRLGAYLSLSMTACAVISVMGARRPGAAAWNFVVCGLLAVFVLPLLSGQMSAAHLIFMSAILIVGALSYLPGRFGICALLIGTACGITLLTLLHPDWALHDELMRGAIGLVGIALWTALLAWPAHTDPGADATWRDFRDRFGALWALRIREQFNLAAKNAKLNVALHWNGLRAIDDAVPANETKAFEHLYALLKRFRKEGAEAIAGDGAAD